MFRFVKRLWSVVLLPVHWFRNVHVPRLQLYCQKQQGQAAAAHVQQRYHDNNGGDDDSRAHDDAQADADAVRGELLPSAKDRRKRPFDVHGQHQT